MKLEIHSSIGILSSSECIGTRDAKDGHLAWSVILLYSKQTAGNLGVNYKFKTRIESVKFISSLSLVYVSRET